jgi:hypothetical protein
MSKYFTELETVNLQPQLVDMLDKAREFADVPFIITSGFRSPGYNASLGGAPNSAHTRGLAVDLRCSDSWVRHKIVVGLLFAGFNRIELCPAHVHADCDPSLPQNVLILGPDL